MSTNTDNLPGFLGGHITFKSFKADEYRKDGRKARDSNSLYYGRSGVENLIPFVLETDCIESWAPAFKSVEMTKKLSSTRFLVDGTYDLPFPMSVR